MIKILKFLPLISWSLFSSVVVAEDSGAEAEPSAYFLAIKGGVSLGSYETGVNRTILNYLYSKEANARLVSFSGASAGSLNSVLSALDSCIIDKNISRNDIENYLSANKKKYKNINHFKYIDNSLDNNFMQAAWDLGIDDLVPTAKDENHYKTLYKTDDAKKNDFDVGMFSRNSFDEKRILIEILKEREADPNCDLTITMSVTKFEALDFKINKIGANVKLQRFVIPIRVKFDETDRKLKFMNSDLPEFNLASTIPGPYLKLVEDECNEKQECFIAFHSIWDVAMASSAFPFAFHPVDLTVCFPHLLQNTRCTRGEAMTSLFSDGGLFDNSPIGVAWDIVESEVNSFSNEKIIYINPDSYRSDDHVSIHVKQDFNIGAMDYVDYFSDSFLTAHESIYKSSIEKILRKSSSSRRFYITHRYHYLLADLHLHFGAFYASEYRMYDYLVGVYDGANVIGQLVCDEKEKFSEKTDRFDDEYKACVRIELLNWINAMPHSNSTSREFIKYLYDSEHTKSLLKPVIKDNKINTYVALSMSFEQVNKTNSKSISYLDYLQRLRTFEKYMDIAAGSDLDKIINNGRTFTSLKISKIMENVIQMQDLSGSCELCKNRDLNNNIGTALKVAETVVDAYLSHHESNIWPKPLFGVLGFNYGFNASQKNQVYGLEYRPEIDFLSSRSFSLDLGLSHHDFGGELADDDYDSASISLVYHTDSLLFPSWGIGFQHETKGDNVYAQDLESTFVKANFLNELITVKFLYRLDEVTKNSIQTRGQEALVISTDLIRICQMVLPNACIF